MTFPCRTDTPREAVTMAHSGADGDARVQRGRCDLGGQLLRCGRSGEVSATLAEWRGGVANVRGVLPQPVPMQVRA